MEIGYTAKAQEDILFWKKSGNQRIMNKITTLLESIKTEPFTGIGKPEQLKHHLTGFWSRRIDREHRIVYEVIEDSMVMIHSLKGHYYG